MAKVSHVGPLQTAVEALADQGEGEAAGRAVFGQGHPPGGRARGGIRASRTALGFQPVGVVFEGGKLRKSRTTMGISARETGQGGVRTSSGHGRVVKVSRGWKKRLMMGET